MKKVMLTITGLGGGGAERVVSVWAKQLREAGYDVSIMTYGRKEDEYPIDPAVSVFTVARNRDEYLHLSYFARLRRMRSILKREQPDVLINFLPRMQIWMMMASFGMKLRRVETVRISPWKACEGSARERALWRICFSRASAVLLQTKEQGEFFSRRVQKKCTVIPNPISAACRDNPKQEYAQNTLHFTAAGRLCPQKNYPVMIEAFRLACSESEKELSLAIYGAGDEKYIEKLQKQINDVGLAGRVKLMGRTNDMASVLHEADAFLMTSDYEGMPNALAEAMAVGLPCISTDCRTGPRDLIDDGENGFLAQTGNARAIADAILRIAAMNGAEAESIGRAARKKALALCGEENSLSHLIALIEA